MATRQKTNGPSIDGLLGKISEKRDTLPRTPVQTVQPVVETEEEAVALGNPVKTLKSKNSKTGKQKAVPLDHDRGPGGRPSLKKASVEYVKISPKIPKVLKKQVDMALVQERFQDTEGNHIKTLDEVVALALERLVMR